MGVIRSMAKIAFVGGLITGVYYLGLVNSGQQKCVVPTQSSLENTITQYKGKLEGTCTTDFSKTGEYTISCNYSQGSASSK